jgi:hypothetical protein
VGAENWLWLQMAYDLAQVRTREPMLKVLTVGEMRRREQPRLL